MSPFTLTYTGAVAIHNSFFGSGSGPFQMAYVRCSGSELTLLHCPSSRPESYSSYCDNSEVAGVRCTTLITTNGEY